MRANLALRPPVVVAPMLLPPIEMRTLRVVLARRTARPRPTMLPLVAPPIVVRVARRVAVAVVAVAYRCLDVVRPRQVALAVRGPRPPPTLEHPILAYVKAVI